MDFIETITIFVCNDWHHIGIEEFTAGNYSASADNDIEFYGEIVYHFIDEDENIIDAPDGITSKDYRMIEQEIKNHFASEATRYAYFD